MFNIETDQEAIDLFKQAHAKDILKQPAFKFFQKCLQSSNEVECYSAEVFKAQAFREISVYFINKLTEQTGLNDYTVLGK